MPMSGFLSPHLNSVHSKQYFWKCYNLLAFCSTKHKCNLKNSNYQNCEYWKLFWYATEILYWDRSQGPGYLAEINHSGEKKKPKQLIIPF